jgi:toxin YoeB
MAYELRYTPIANMGLANLERNEPKAFGKALRLLEEIQEHPRTGTGHPEQLSGDLTGKWSRRITKKHRLIYEIHDMEVIVIVISAYGHYSDK